MQRQLAVLVGWFVASGSSAAFAWDGKGHAAIWDKSPGPSFVAHHGVTPTDPCGPRGSIF